MDPQLLAKPTLLVTLGALVILRKSIEGLKSREEKLLNEPAAALARSLFQLTAPSVLAIRLRRRQLNAVCILVLGLCLSSVVLHLTASSTFAGLSALICWGSIGFLAHKQHVLEAIDEGIAPRPSPKTSGASTESRQQLPVTMLTGFLGAGKTTLLRRILSESHGQRLLVIENELGAEGIDDELVADHVRGGDDTDVILLRNGCLCCTIRNDLRQTLLKILPRVTELDGVLIETTGVAKPAPVLQTLLLEPKLRAALRLDAVVTVVDCAHARRQLDAAVSSIAADGQGLSSSHAAVWGEQVAYADRVILNKMDLASAEEAEYVRAAVRAINPGAGCLECERCQVPLGDVLHLHSFDVAEALEYHPLFDLEPVCSVASVGGGVGKGGGPEFFGSRPRESLRTACLRVNGDLDEAKFNSWIGRLLSTHGEDLLRMKGVLAVAGRARRLIFQAVHMQFEGDLGSEFTEGETRQCKMVVIGRKLPADLQLQFEGCRAVA